MEKGGKVGRLDGASVDVVGQGCEIGGRKRLVGVGMCRKRQLVHDTEELPAVRVGHVEAVLLLEDNACAE